MLAFFVCGKSLEKESVMWLMEKKIWEDWRIINIFVRERILRTWDTHTLGGYCAMSEEVTHWVLKVRIDPLAGWERIEIW